MASTNKTPKLGLNQYVSTDKPTMADYNADMLKIDNSIAGIIGSGSNANGSFIKFSDGTMICKTYVASQTTDSTGRVTWTFPAAFLTGEIPTVTVSTVASLSSTQNAIIGTTPTPTGVVFLHTMNGAAINAQAVRYCATAIGRWK